MAESEEGSTFQYKIRDSLLWILLTVNIVILLVNILITINPFKVSYESSERRKLIDEMNLQPTYDSCNHSLRFQRRSTHVYEQIYD